jgi:hypothetical protein
MSYIDEATLEQLRKQFPIGTRVELLKMNDPFSNKLCPGSQGTVVSVDDIGTIHVAWDCGSSLGIVCGEDACKKVNTP